MKFTDEIKEVREFSDNNYFDYGVHKVQIGSFELGETDKGSEYLEVAVIGENGEEDTARVWFSSVKAAGYSFNTMRQIAVHNAKDADKDAMRDAMDATTSTEELLQLLNEKVVGGECWFTKYQSPDRTYTANDGSVRKSVDKNVYGYEPKLKANLVPTPLDKADGLDIVDGEISDDGKVNIPNWDK